MKKISSTLAIIAAALISSCTKEPKRTTSVPFISATGTDGTSVYATDTLVIASLNKGLPYPFLGVTGRTTVLGNTTGFWIYSYRASTGTFALDGVNAGAFFNESTGTAHNSAHGTLTITSVSLNITGTIIFTCNDSTVVSSTFNVIAP